MAMAWKFGSTLLAVAGILAGGNALAGGSADSSVSHWTVLVWTDPLTVLVDTYSIEHRPRVLSDVGMPPPPPSLKHKICPGCIRVLRE